MPASVFPTSDEKRTALELVLNSNTFARADQLRNFLRYVCEMELAGRGSEISEYLIGVDALGKREGYSTGDDSTVRARAHALRQKLQEFYDKEMPGAQFHIELPKGCYSPRFVESGAHAGLEDFVPEQGRNVAESGIRRPWIVLGWGAAFLLGCAIATAIFLLLPNTSKADPILAEAWGPLARPNGNVVVCLATPAHLVVQPYRDGLELPSDSFPVPPGVLEWYQKHRTLAAANHLFMNQTNNAIPLGEALGALALVQALDGFSTSHQVLSERTVSTSALRGRNAMVLGNPEYSTIVEKLLLRGKLSIEYDPKSQERVIRSWAAPGATFLPRRDQYGAQAESFGMITVLPSDGANNGRQRTVAFSGTTSAGMQAAVEFFVSSASMRDLRERFRKDYGGGFPAAYQVVVRCRTDNVLPLSFSYETHLRLDAVN